MHAPNQQKRVLLVMGKRYNNRIHHGVAQHAGQKHWHLTNLFGDKPDLIRHRECDGIITGLDNNDPLSDLIIQRKKPTVNLSIIRKNKRIPNLTGDNLAMGHYAASHFLERGFRNFIWFSEHNHAVAQQRLHSYQAELKSKGFDCLRMIVNEAFPQEIPPWKPLQQWILETIQSVPWPCAAYAYNDIQAVNLLDACIAGGIRVPDDVAILGTDDNPLNCPTAAVPLSSINNDLEQLGQRAAETLEEIIDGKRMDGQTTVIPSKGITVRQSTDIFAVNDSHLRKALQFIYSNYHRSVSVSEIVAETGLSRRALEERFNKHLQSTILEKLNEIRLKSVCRLLKQTNLNIVDIALQTGFSTPEYLHRVFRKTLKMTPKNYQKQNADKMSQ